MNTLESLLLAVSAELKKQARPWALVGGLAVSIRTEPRFTRDLDLAVAVADDSEAENLVHNFHRSGFKTFATVEHEKTKRLATARIAPDASSQQGLVLDMLFASSGIEPEICMEAENLLVFENLSVPVASMHHLIALKTLSRDDHTRPQDAADLRQLIHNATPSDRERAIAAAKLIEARGYNRERQLTELVMQNWNQYR